MVITTQFESNCGAFFTSPLKWICTALVPQRIWNKYRNRYMATNEPYSIFQLEGQNTSYLLVFHYLEMFVCQTIRLTDLHNILCVNEYNESSNLFFGFSHGMCYNYSMNLTSDLKAYCGAKGNDSDFESGYYFANVENNEEVKAWSGCGLLGSPTLVVCLLLSLVLVLCLRCRDITV